MCANIYEMAKNVNKLTIILAIKFNKLFNLNSKN